DLLRAVRRSGDGRPGGPDPFAGAARLVSSGDRDNPRRACLNRIDEARPFIPVGIAVLTVSDSRTLANDKSGDTLVGRITEAGHKLVDRAIVADDKDRIYDRVHAWTLSDEIDVVITTGGTGFTGRDVTPEALEPLFEKRM